MPRNIISHSEVDQFLSCERKHYYAFGVLNPDGSRGLESKTMSDGLFRGNLGHAALEAHYKYLGPISIEREITNDDINAGKDLAQAVITKALTEHLDRSELILSLMIIIEAYIEHYRQEDKNYQFLAIETEFRLDVDDDITFPFKPDLIRRHRKTGKVEVVDHKFLANLYTGNEIAIQPQLPKYVGSLRNLGYQVDGAVYDLVCHRVLKTKPYDASTSMRRVPLILNQTRVARSLKEQHDAVRKIQWFKMAPPEVWEDSVIRSASSFNCKHCPFLAMCVADLNGEDTTVMVKYEFQPNTYGYDKESTANV